MRLSLPIATGVAALSLLGVLQAPPIAAVDELGTATSATHVDFPDGSSLDATASGSNVRWAGNYCMRNDGRGACNWGGIISPNVADFTGVYSNTAVPSSLGGGLEMTQGAMESLCRAELAPSGSTVVAEGTRVSCNGGNAVGSVTFTFSQPVTSAVMHIHNVGGSSGYSWPGNGPHYDVSAADWNTFWPTFSLQTPGVSLSLVSSRGNLSVTPSTIGVASDVGDGIDPSTTWGQVWGYPLPSSAYTIAGVSAPNSSYTMGSGSVRLSSSVPFSSVTFDIAYTLLVYDIVGAGTLTRDSLYTSSDWTEFLWSLGDGNSASTTVEARDPVFTLTYDGNGGICRAPSQTAVDGTWVSTHDSAACSRDAYTFLGWNTSAAGDGLSLMPGGPTQITSDNTLYAQWEPVATIIAVDDSDSTPYETPLFDTVATNDTYPAGSGFTKLTDPTNGSLAFNPDGSFTYTPNSGFSGTDFFTYRVCAPNSTTRCAEATQTITVPGPGKPVATPRKRIIPAGDVTPVRFSPHGSSKPAAGSQLQRGAEGIAPMGTSKWVSRVAVPGKGTWRLRDGVVTFTPLTSFDGVVRIRYRVQDANGEVAHSTFTVVTSDVPSLIDGGKPRSQVRDRRA